MPTENATRDPGAESRKLAWDLFCDLRKELVELQKIRAQVIGFKITFVSAALGLVAINLDKVPPLLIVVPAVASVCFDFLTNSYSYSIKRTGFYARSHLEPIFRPAGWPANRPLWEEFMNSPHAGRNLARLGNVGITVLAVLAAMLIMFTRADPLLAAGVTAILIGLLVWDARTLSRPSLFADAGPDRMGFRNPKPCVAVVLRVAGRYVLAKRKNEPGAGKWDVPGGFIDPGESAEAAAARELREETGIDVPADHLVYIGTVPDVYGESEVPTLNLCYVVRLKEDWPLVPQEDEIEEFGYFERAELPLDDLAFPHQQVLLTKLLPQYEKSP